MKILNISFHYDTNYGNIKRCINTLESLVEGWKNRQRISMPYHRQINTEITNLIDKRQIIILSGLRRVGKTTLLYQLIEELIKKHPINNILYFSMDKEVDELIEVMNAYEELTISNWKKERYLSSLMKYPNSKNEEVNLNCYMMLSQT
ncbi:MAG: AAA family ATPase [Nanoarchaeota archaeon]